MQSLVRGLLSRRRYKRDRRNVVLVQSLARRRSARKELVGLKAEARSVVHFKEISNRLENKVVELTQALQKRTQENKTLHSRVSDMQNQLQLWQQKFDEADNQAKALRTEAEKPSVPMLEFQALDEQKNAVESKLAASLRKVTLVPCSRARSSLILFLQIAEQDDRIEKLNADYVKQAEEMDKRQTALDELTASGVADASTLAGLRQEVSSLRDQLSRAVNNPKPVYRGDPTFQMTTGQNGMTNGVRGSPSQDQLGFGGKRKVRRHSAEDYTGDVVDGTNGPANYDSPRAVSVPYATGVPAYPEDDLEDPSEAIMRILEDEEPLDEDVLNALIKSLKLPTPSVQNPPTPKEVLFPAHLISLVTNEMWKYGLMRESERFLANVMQTVQQHVMVCAFVVVRGAPTVLTCE